MAKNRETFGSRFAVIVALAGSAIGLGNIWRFPYTVGEGGGAAFILLYLFFSFCFSLPIFMVESIIGRRSGANCLGAVKKLSSGKIWRLLGVLSIITPLIIVSYYSVVGGWSIEFFLKSCSLSFLNADPESVSGIFGSFTSSFWGPTICFTAFLAATCLIVAGGVKKGIERFSKFCIPVLFVMIVLIMIFSLSLPGAKAGVDYLLKPDFSKLDFSACASALGQSFYSLSLGMGIIITYGSYVRKDEDILVTSAGTAISDLLFALLAGLAIMPAVFAAGIEPGAGPGLIFQSIPYIFSRIGETAPVISTIMSVLFFLTIIVAAMTSCISLIEVGVAYAVEHFKLKRLTACLILFLICGSLGVISSLSFGPLENVKVLGRSFFDLFDWICSNILLLVMAFLAVVFVGFVLGKDAFRDEITNSGSRRIGGWLFETIFFLVKWVAPVAVVLIFITNFIL